MDRLGYRKLESGSEIDDGVALDDHGQVSTTVRSKISGLLQQLCGSWPLRGILFVLYSLALFSAGWMMSDVRRPSPVSLYSPAKAVVEHMRRDFTTSINVSFIGPPNHELDRHWHDAMKGIHIRVSADELKGLGRLKNNAVALPDGSGFVVMLNVYHQLHCVLTLQRALSPDHYWPHEDAEDRHDRQYHIDHCLDYLRQSLTCHADLGVSTYEWHDDTKFPVSMPMTHECINWNRLDTWAKGRSVQMTAKGLLVHPKLGVVYPNGPTVYETADDLRDVIINKGENSVT